MAGMSEAFRAHVAGGMTTLCRCWSVVRRDRVTFGFTDHDCTLRFDGMEFAAETGLAASALQQTTGISVDNSEALGALSDAAVTEDDIKAGRFDAAEVSAWLVNWADVSVRWLQFRGTIGEIRRSGGAFRAELRGLTEALNRPVGRAYQRPCTAVLGDAQCRFDLSQPGYAVEIETQAVTDRHVFRWDALEGFEPGWFQRGRLSVLEGPAAGLWAPIKHDRIVDGIREIELWEPIRAAVAAPERVKLEAGCDKRLETCKLKFGNLINYQGFPDIPGEDWMMSVPKKTGVNSGGSRR
ncbi:MAG: hypothetical protein CML02_02710 [Pseudooceanicola sp.]|jgi:uncharacterized phage protein (TIGR02218 family)|nr:hypothetical protein [Pseudooceanicola sp.]|tara:strand:+ start:4334 stop:5221 length:888 start_codon:yes stop_codon:yes gene_type:complete